MRKLLLSLFVLLLFVFHTMAQERTVRGTVKGKDDGLPLPGVSVRVKGTSTGTQTGPNGQFSLRVSGGSAVLVFTYVGYATQEVQVGNKTTLNVELGTDQNQLNEVVVTAGGIRRAVREQGYTSTVLRAQELTQAKVTNIASGLTAKVPGLQVNAVSSGVNPNVRLVLRGNRSITGNNQALVVLDNVPVPNAILSNLNPEDIESINVLNGANAAALYGSSASNGALVITTKKGTAGKSAITVSNTTSFEKVSFYPKLQTKFGSGSTEGDPSYIPFENQQYGPAFDGSMVQIGKPLEDGSIQMVKYSPRDDKKKFWDTGLTNQTDFSLTNGTEKSSIYIAAQYVDVAGTTPKDKYNRTSLRVNGTRDLGSNFNFTFQANYVQNRYDITTATSSIYDNLLNTPAHIPLLDYKDWQNNPFANPNGYYNEYYDNPYFALDNERQKVRNDYLIGSTELQWNPLKWLGLTYRIGVTTQNNSSKSRVGKFVYSDYRKEISGFTDIAGSVSDASYYKTQIISDFLASFNQDVKDFSFKFIVGHQLVQNESKTQTISADGLVIPGLYNVSNRTGNLGGSEANYKKRLMGVYGDLTIGYKNYAFLHASGRNDWNSLLAANNRSYFYPAIDASFIPTDAFPMLKENNVIDYIKVRGGWSKVGQVNLTTTADDITYGAYRLAPTFENGAGFPYGSVAGYSLSSAIVSTNLKPEMTRAYEMGFDMNLLNDRISTSLTYYKSNTKDQTIPTQISRTTGFNSYLFNAGEVSNEGVETSLSLTPLRTPTGWEVTVGANYTYNNSKVLSLSEGLPQLSLGGYTNGYAAAVPGYSFPVIYGSVYNRDSEGRIIVDRVSGNPSQASDLQILGSTVPKHRLGLNAEVKYKSLRLAALFEYRGGYVVYNQIGTTLDFSGSSARSASYDRQRFVIPNSSYEDPSNPGTYLPNTDIAVSDGGVGFWAATINRSIAENYVISGNYWKLRELSLAYALPASLVARTKYIKGATISLQGRNLFLWVPKANQYTDPDYNYSDNNAIGINNLSQTPPTRYFGATLSVTF